MWRRYADTRLLYNSPNQLHLLCSITYVVLLLHILYSFLILSNNMFCCRPDVLPSVCLLQRDIAGFLDEFGISSAICGDGKQVLLYIVVMADIMPCFSALLLYLVVETYYSLSRMWRRYADFVIYTLFLLQIL